MWFCIHLCRATRYVLYHMLISCDIQYYRSLVTLFFAFILQTSLSGPLPIPFLDVEETSYAMLVRSLVSIMFNALKICVHVHYYHVILKNLYIHSSYRHWIWTAIALAWTRRLRCCWIPCVPTLPSNLICSMIKSVSSKTCRLRNHPLSHRFLYLPFLTKTHVSMLSESSLQPVVKEFS